MSDSGMQQLNQELMKEMRAQGERHASEINGLANKVEQNTEVVRKCMMDLVEFNAERSNLTRCLMEMKTQMSKIADDSTSGKIKMAELDTRWAMTKAFIGVNMTAMGIVIAWLKLF